MICLQNVTLAFQERTVFQNLHLSFPDRGAVALMGPSGGGKTTLLRLLAGLLPPTQGKVLGLEGKKISFLFQEDRLLPWLTAERNVEIVSNRALALEWLKRMEIDDPRQYPRQMSGGMQRRVSLARALAYQGDVLLLDEPFKGLDEGLRSRIAGRIKGQAGLTVLSIHDAAEAALMDAEIWQLDHIIGGDIR